MRRIVLFDRLSADGYFAAPDGNLNWVVPDPELDRSVMAAADRAAARTPGPDPGTILFGRRTYEMFESFWPTALDGAGGVRDPHGPGRNSPELRGMAIWINAAKKLVFSRTRQTVTWSNSRLLHAFDPREITELKRQPGGDILVFGSGSIATQLSAHRLIDEYQLIITPLLLGAGRSLINGMPGSLRLELLEAKPFPSGNVMLRYAPSR
jgi:dihydrofolate reductase